LEQIARTGLVIGDRYRLERRLGRGATSEAWAALDQATGRRVAVKLEVGPGAQLTAELTRLRGLRHPRVVEVQGLGRHAIDGARITYLVTSLVEGTTLDAWAPGRSARAIADALADALEGLVFLHDAGLRHGDVKPANVVVGEDGRAVLIDLGLAAPLDEVPVLPSGTPRYMAPELLDGTGAGTRADLYALGVTLREALALAGAADPRLDTIAAHASAPAMADRPVDGRALLERLGREAPPLAGASRAPRLFEREAHLAAFERALARCASGAPGPRVLVVEGADGLGRTRLVRELRWNAEPRCDVHETWSTDRAPLRGALSRLAGRALDAGLEALLEARDAIAARSAPTVLFADDVHTWPPTEREALAALARTAAPTGSLLLVAAARPRTIDVEPSSAMERLELAPLSGDAVRRWCESALASDRADEVLRASGGYPADVERALVSQRRATTDLAFDDPGPGGRHAAAAIVVGDGKLDDAQVTRWAVDEAALVAWQREGLVRREEGAWKLTRPSDLARMSAIADPAALQALHADMAGTLAHAVESDPDAASEARAARARHLARAGRIADAIADIVACREADRARAPAAWIAAVDALSRDALVTSASTAIAAARILSEGGDSRRALSLVAAALRRRPEPVEAVRLRVEAGGALIRAGRAHRAVRVLTRALIDAVGELRAEALAQLARSHAELGEHAAAEQRALESLACMGDDGLAAAHEALGIARIYLGRPDAAEPLTLAWRRSADRAPRQRAKLLSFLAIADYRRGALASARERYVEALAIAERHGLLDVLATAALNLATVDQQLGDWGAALAGYERSLRAARAVDRPSTEVTALHNLANLYAAIGVVDRAEHALDEVEAREAASAPLRGAIASLRGELARAQGRLDVAAEAFERALAFFEAQRATREIAECCLQRSTCAREPGDAAPWLARAEAAARDAEAADLDARVRLERGRRAMEAGRSSEALRLLERARAASAGELHLEAEIDAALARVAAAAGASALAESHAARARERFERIALTLPEAYRATFLRQPSRALEPRSAPETARPSTAERLLAINARLNSTLSTEAVLEHAIDAAIELTGAERGFVLLASTDRREVEVAAARNLDRERIGRSHLKFSRSVAEGVLRSRAPVLTTDAQADARFRDHESVHAMRLSSIVCVPIVAPSGVLGAIYLDNRFERGRFSEADVRTLSACADQVALALTNARLVAELERRSAELEAERDRVRELLREREARIEELEAEVAGPRASTRYAYPEIVGRGAAMRAVLSVLDRVIDSPLSVVIEGESGTGKELIARAIHHHGPRRAAPLRSVNCGALPDTLLEGELFGWKRGAFTGADRDRDGVFVAARGGTVFLDEVGEMSPAMQTKLLRVLQQREVQPLGASTTVEIDVRIVAATNRSLREEVRAGRLREDLFYRLAVVEVRLPPLRERREDLPELVRHVLERRAAELGIAVPRVHPDAMRWILRHDWPGNVRELENTLSRALVMGDRELVRAADLGLEDAIALPRGRKEMQAEQARSIVAALAETRWNVSEVARKLGIPRTTLYRTMKRHGIEPR
jgi:transcriptional regulator with GAF, ATPase, and Fis domain